MAILCPFAAPRSGRPGARPQDPRSHPRWVPALLRLAVLVALLAGSCGPALWEPTRPVHVASGWAFGATPVADTFTAPPVLVNRSLLPQTVEVDLTAEPTPWSLI